MAEKPKSSFAAGNCVVPSGDPGVYAHRFRMAGPGVLPSRAVMQQIQVDMAKFSRCMRANGVANWPDPTLDQGRAVFDPGALGIDTNSPRISTTIQDCEDVFPASVGIPSGA